MKKSFLFSALLLLACRLLSQTTSWTGAVDSTWHNASNWTSGIPADTVDVIIGDANYFGSFQPAVLAAANCKTLTLSAGFKLKVYTSDTIRLKGNLTNNGLIQGDSASFAFHDNNAVLCGTGTAVYKSLHVLSGVNFTINKNIILSGNLVVDGSLSALGKTLTFTGTAPSVIDGSGSIMLGNIVVDKTSSFMRLEAPVTVAGSLTLANGIVHTNSSALLTLADNATASSGNSGSYVDGPMQKLGDDAFVFPLGNNGVWARLGISTPSLAGDGFVAQYHANAYANTDSIVPSTPALTNVSKVEYWTCERSSGSANVAVTLYWEDNVRSDFDDFANLVVAHWNGSAWENAGNAGILPLAQGNITSLLQTAFSSFTFGSLSTSNPMPIGLLNFSAKLNASEAVELVWQTATETNNHYFTIEKSTDGMTYEAAATIDGAGTSLVAHSYRYADTEPYKGTTYYRLKQTDHNGAFTYSPVRMVRLENDRTEIVVYPNPSNGRGFSVGLAGDAKIDRIVLFNSMGQQVLEVAVQDADLATVEVAAPGTLPGGVYTLVAIGDEHNYKKKLVVEAR